MKNEEFSIYSGPLSDETKKIRVNLLLSSTIGLFVAISGSLPEQFSLLGLTFSSSQQDHIGWFLVALIIYFLVHFLVSAGVEIANWIKPFLVKLNTRREVLKRYSHAFDETDFFEDFGPVDEQNKTSMYNEVEAEIKWQTEKKLRVLSQMIYLKLIIEVIMPVVLAMGGIYTMIKLIT